MTSLGCTPCARVKRILNELRKEMSNLAIEEIEFGSPAGSKLAMENGILYPPAVFVDGTLIAKGKIDADELVASIRELNGVRN